MATGFKSGGRQKGSINRATAAKVQEVKATGTTPLDFMLAIMRDPEADETRRLDAAKSAAPYIHPRLTSIDANVEGRVGLTVSIVQGLGDE